MAMAEAERRYLDDGPVPGAAPDRAWQLAFEEAWPAVERSLRRVLRARRVPRDEWEDYLQEVAARALAAHVEFACAADLLPWASTVLRRLHARQLQRAHRLSDAQSRVRVRGTPDVASTVIAKLDLDRVAEVVAAWSPVDREVLTTVSTTTSTSYVRRHRLRAKLLTVIDGLGAGVAGLRRVRFRVLHAPQADQLAATVLSPAALACVALALPFIGGGSGSPDNAPAHEMATRAPQVALVAPASVGGHDAGGVADRGTGAGHDGGKGGDGGGGHGGGRPGYHEAEIGTDAAGHSVIARVEDDRQDETVVCATQPPFGRQCVDYPVHVDDVRVDVPDLPAP